MFPLLTRAGHPEQWPWLGIRPKVQHHQQNKTTPEQDAVYSKISLHKRGSREILGTPVLGRQLYLQTFNLFLQMAFATRPIQIKSRINVANPSKHLVYNRKDQSTPCTFAIVGAGSSAVAVAIRPSLRVVLAN